MIARPPGRPSATRPPGPPSPTRPRSVEAASSEGKACDCRVFDTSGSTSAVSGRGERYHDLVRVEHQRHLRRVEDFEQPRRQDRGHHRTARAVVAHRVAQHPPVQRGSARGAFDQSAGLAPTIAYSPLSDLATRCAFALPPRRPLHPPRGSRALKIRRYLPHRDTTRAVIVAKSNMYSTSPSTQPCCPLCALATRCTFSIYGERGVLDRRRHVDRDVEL